MGEGDNGLSDDFKLTTLWREHEEKKRLESLKREKPVQQTLKDNIIPITLMGAIAFGSGPDVIQTLLKLMVGK